jgi:hypothetical protein
MTNPEYGPEDPVPSDLSTVAAFLDGEPVDGAALKSALETAEGRDYLVDLLVLRQSVVHMAPIAVVRPTPRPERSIRHWAVAAALLLLASAGSYAIGARAASVAPVEGARSSIEAVIDLPPSAAPKPTEVIRLEPGVNWHSSGGR